MVQEEAVQDVNLKKKSISFYYKLPLAGGSNLNSPVGSPINARRAKRTSSVDRAKLRNDAASALDIDDD